MPGPHRGTQGPLLPLPPRLPLNLAASCDQGLLVLGEAALVSWAPVLSGPQALHTLFDGSLLLLPGRDGRILGAQQTSSVLKTHGDSRANSGSSVLPAPPATGPDILFLSIQHLEPQAQCVFSTCLVAHPAEKMARSMAFGPALPYGGTWAGHPGGHLLSGAPDLVRELRLLEDTKRQAQE